MDPSERPPVPELGVMANEDDEDEDDDDDDEYELTQLLMLSRLYPLMH